MSDRYFCKGIRGVMLLHRTEDTRFQNGYNRYGDSKHYDDYTPTVIPASEGKIDEAQRDYQAAADYQQYCETYEQTYDPETGAM